MRFLTCPTKEEFESVRQPHPIDFCWCEPGELLGLGFVCDSHQYTDRIVKHGRRERMISSCGCDRAFSGVTSAKSTTVAKVVEMDEADARAAFDAGSWATSWVEAGMDADEMFRDSVKLLHLVLFRNFEVGDLVMIHSNGEWYELFRAKVEESNHADHQ